LGNVISLLVINCGNCGILMFRVLGKKNNSKRKRTSLVNRTPSVIYNDVILVGGIVVEPGQKLLRFPVGAVGLPVAVRPDQIWLVAAGGSKTYHRVREDYCHAYIPTHDLVHALRPTHLPIHRCRPDADRTNSRPDQLHACTSRGDTHRLLISLASGRYT